MQCKKSFPVDHLFEVLYCAEGFISSAVKNVATNGFPLLPPEGIREATATLYVPH
jgi:hypothetical protein